MAVLRVSPGFMLRDHIWRGLKDLLVLEIKPGVTVYRMNFFSLFGEAYLVVLRNYSSHTQESLLEELRGIYSMPRTKSGLATCKSKSLAHYPGPTR